MKSTVWVLFSMLAAAAAVGAQTKKPFAPKPPAPFAESRQALVVTTADWTTFKGRARLFERRSGRSKWRPAGAEFAVVVGRSGTAWGAGLHALPTDTNGRLLMKTEGDGKSPAGIFALTEAFGAPEKPAAARLPFTRLGEFTECVDDVKSTHYNRLVDRLKVGNFDWKSSEKMLAVGAEYELGIFVAHNSFPVERGGGSCIFLHIWKDAETGTAGCTAMAREHLTALIDRVDPAKNPVLVQLPEDSYERFQNAWKLPKR